MLIDRQLPMQFWAEAIRTAVYTNRRTPTSSLSKLKSSYEMLFNKKPEIAHFRRFGCTAYPYLAKEQQVGKFVNRASKCMMLVYVHDTIGIYRIWDFSGRGRAVECSNIRFQKELNAYGL
jgi:hypothetical protein